MKRAALVATLGLALWTSTASAAVIPVPCLGTIGDSAALGAAVTEANNTPATPDTLSLGANCTYSFQQQDFNGGWYGFHALPAIASDITIQGNGATLARGDVPNRFRFFFVGADPTDPDTLDYVTPGPGILRLRDLTLTGGVAQGGNAGGGGGGAGLGGAIFNQGTLIVERSTFVGNSAEGGASETSSGNGGGGLASNSNSGNGGGMAGLGALFGQPGGSGASGGSGGGAGLRTTAGQEGTNGSTTQPGDGGGPRTGTGGSGAGISGAMSGDGSGGGGNTAGGSNGGSGGRFGAGGNGLGGGGGGGAGGGGGSGSPGAGGGGGFGGGGGWGLAGGGSGGFGGGAGGAPSGMGGIPGFGGGTPGTDVSHGGGGAGMGGAIFNMQGSVTIINSTFTGNSATGGGPFDVSDPADGMGGAVFNLSGSFTAVGSTFALNTASDRGTSIYNLVYDDQTARTAQVTLRNTIVGSALGPVADLVSDGSTYNLILNLGTADAAVGDRNLVRSRATIEDGTITGTPLTADPLLAALASNGGLTQTMAPRDGSPALDAGAAYGLTIDQRGVSRTVDLPSVVNFGDATDIGAVERQLPAGPGDGNQPPAAFGARTLVSLAVVRRVGPRGPLRVIVRNRNAFGVSGRLSGRSANKLEAGASRRRVIRLRAKRLSVAAGSRKTIRLRLPRAVRRTLRSRRVVALRLTARVSDPAGNVRTVKKRAKPRLRRARR